MIHFKSVAGLLVAVKASVAFCRQKDLPVLGVPPFRLDAVNLFVETRCVRILFSEPNPRADCKVFQDAVVASEEFADPRS
jgi:hypothetical protein